MTLTIAISGRHGAGKSTVAKALAKTFSLRYISAGDIFRRLAQERGLSLSEFSRLAERDHKIDKAIDARTSQEAAKGNVVIDAYIAGWVARDFANLKIYLHAPLEVRAHRIALRDNRDYEEILDETQTREASQKQRFLDYYGFDVTDIRFFDIILNTETWNEKAIIHLCTEAVKAYQSSSVTTGE